MSKYIKGWLLPISVVLATWAFMHGGWWLLLPFVVTVILFTVGDWVLPADLSEPLQGQRFMLNLPLYAILPLLFIMNFTLLWLMGTGDFLGYGAWVVQHLGIDLQAAREATTHGGMWVGSVLSAAIMNAYGGTVAGHELTHRTARPFDLFVGRWMLALTADTTFAIEHVYGHHVRVATPADPATALRGESFYSFTVRSTLEGYVHAYQLERDRMVKLGKSIWNPLASPFMRGMLENIVLFLAAYVIAGWAGVWLWFAVIFVGKQFLELTNYFEHYGLIREPGKPVQPRHSWNSNHWMSSNVLYSLARHSHHHAEADAPFWTLNAYPDAPMLPGGYITMVLIGLYPPLFKRIMAPALLEWDRKHASPGELRLAAEANRRSGMPELMVANS